MHCVLSWENYASERKQLQFRLASELRMNLANLVGNFYWTKK